MCLKWEWPNCEHHVNYNFRMFTERVGFLSVKWGTFLEAIPYFSMKFLI